MPRIQTVSENDATGIVKTGYEMFKEKAGIIPKPMEMMSASPALFEMQLKRIEYFSKHPNLSFELLSHIRYLAAHTLDYPFCMDFNGMVLQKLGLSQEDIKAMESDLSRCLLEENETAMLSFVVKAMKDPRSVTDKDIEQLKEMGWTDADMLDALAQGVSMIDHSIMMQAFDIDQKCLL